MIETKPSMTVNEAEERLRSVLWEAYALSIGGRPLVCPEGGVLNGESETWVVLDRDGRLFRFRVHLTPDPGLVEGIQ